MESLGVKSLFWPGKRVLLTGHTGFKGAWLAFWLNRLGVQVTGISLPPVTEPNLFTLAGIHNCCESYFCDIKDRDKLHDLVRRAKPEILFHFAAQALVRPSYREPLSTFATNVMGTANILDALRGLNSIKAVIMVTTDKVYHNHEWPWPYRETDALGGHDPYSASKAASEIVIASYRHAFLGQQGVAIASARAGNVIGGGDWSEDRLIPDAVRCWQSGQTLMVRRPQSVRPWQHVLEPLGGYLTLTEQLWTRPEIAGAFNFGPEPHESATVRHVIEMALSSYGEGSVQYGDGSEGPHEAGYLALDIAKARNVLGYSPRWSLTEAIQRTCAWYRRQRQGERADVLCEQEIAAFEAAQ
jgi:CDP-glucose 4,6-dehydratase